jgi:hypothetical protein
MFSMVFGLVLVMSCIVATGQIRPSRTLNLVALDDTSARPGWLAGGRMAGTLGRGSGSLGEDRAWMLQLHEMFDIARFDDDAAITLSLHQEMDANDLNNIGFNPRMAIWEENLAWQWGRPFRSQGRVGVFHRCKHDIDNTDTPDERDDSLYVPTRRVIILSGVNGAWTLPRVRLPSGHARVMLTGEGYLISEEYRDPSGIDSGSWSPALASVGLYAYSDLALSSWLTFIVRTSVTATFFGANDATGDPGRTGWDGRVEGAFAMRGTAGWFEAFVAGERFFDEVATLPSQTTAYVQFGVRLRSAGSW